MPAKSKARGGEATRPGRWRRWPAWALAGLLLGFALYIFYLDRLVGARFDGDTWALPSRVYARALELYPGLRFSREQLEHELALDSYLAVEREPLPGQYRRLGASLEIHARGFDFGDGLQPAASVQVFFDGERIAALADTRGGGELALFRLPPVIIGSYYPDNGQDRLLLDGEAVPPLLLDTLIAVEDRGFYDHHGLSPRAVARALWANLRAGRAVQGGSTLTQQLAKNLFLTRERTLTRKINEAFMALLLELRLDKQAIATAYLNEVYLLQHNRIAIHGFARASRMLLRRGIEHLEPRHIALLVGMVQGPSRYNPLSAPQAARERRDRVLRIMLDRGLIDAERYAVAAASPLGVVERLPAVNPFPAYLDLVKRQLDSAYSAADLRRRGLRIFTAFDPQVQRNLELGVADGLARFEQPELQAAAVVVDYLSGDVLALQGDRVSDYPGFNRALLAQRPIGSLIKPLLLYSLLGTGRNLATPVRDEALRIRQSDGKVWEPRNFDREQHGEMTLYQAFVRSYNLPFVRLGVDGGLDPLAQNLATIGLLKHDPVYPSILLGTSPMSAFEVAQMMQVIANSGFFTPLNSIRRVAATDGGELERVPLTSVRLFDETRMIQVQRAMIGVAEHGTASYLRSRFGELTLAGKTGSTNDDRDSWFAGFGSRLLGVVWLGRDDNRPIGLGGAEGALRVWADIMARQRPAALKLGRDDQLAWRRIHPLDGGLVRDSCRLGVLLPFPRAQVPERRSACREVS